MVCKVNTEGTGFMTLLSFTNGSDGANPVAGLNLSGNTLYGTAQIGGSSGSGTVFALNTDGTGFTILHSFTGLGFDVSTNGVCACTDSVGAYLECTVTLRGNLRDRS